MEKKKGNPKYIKTKGPNGGTGYALKNRENINSVDVTKLRKLEEDILQTEQHQIAWEEQQLAEWEKRNAKKAQQELAELPERKPVNELQAGEETNLEIFLQEWEIENQGPLGQYQPSFYIDVIDEENETEWDPYITDQNYLKKDIENLAQEGGNLKIVLYETIPDEDGYSKGDMLWYQTANQATIPDVLQ